MTYAQMIDATADDDIDDAHLTKENNFFSWQFGTKQQPLRGYTGIVSHFIMI
ncbi:hypothetical protein CI610_02514 [invertebrate metagenome]|uniref:Uncharacterized protein n=1 Tax=invertebrate metagenome TaxID=1711999 RepID=A0A2H9T5Q9_9ZZZZ